MSDIAVQTPSTDLAISREQSGFTEKQVAMLRQLGIDDASEGDIDLFFHRCKVTGLDPFSRQIYMIGRRTKVKVWNEAKREQEDKWVMKYTIQTGIDGYRLNGARAARKRDDVVSIGSPMWRGVESGWDDVWFDKTRPPAAARFTITVNGNEFTATAMYHEYVQTNRDGSPNSMWAKMPANQLAKCAEAAAWRKAYPDDFSDLVLEDAVQIIDENGDRVTVASERVGSGARNIRSQMGIGERRASPIDITDTLAEAEKVPAEKPQASRPSSARPSPEPASPGDDKPATAGQIKALKTLFKKEGREDWAAQLEWLQGNTIAQDISALDQLNDAQAAVAIEALQ